MIHNDFSNQGALEHALEHWKLQNELYIIITECLFIKYCSSGKNHFFEVLFFLFQKGSYFNARLTWSWKCRKKNRKVEIFYFENIDMVHMEQSSENWKTLIEIQLLSPLTYFFQHQTLQLLDFSNYIKARKVERTRTKVCTRVYGLPGSRV